MTLGALENILHAHCCIICRHELECVESEKDLGVAVDSTLKFGAHILKMSKLANSMMGLTRRVFSHLGPSMFIPLCPEPPGIHTSRLVAQLQESSK